MTGNISIQQTELHRYSQAVGSLAGSYAGVLLAKRQGKQTAFLSHSHKDAELAKGVQGFLQALGWEVYIDWQDTAMPETPNRETADRIQQRIRELDWFLFLATRNSVTSRWCPWEIGYADGTKRRDSIVIIPTADQNGSYGSEYLDLYRWLSPSQGGGYGVYPAGAKTGGVALGNLVPPA